MEDDVKENTWTKQRPISVRGELNVSTRSGAFWADGSPPYALGEKKFANNLGDVSLYRSSFVTGYLSKGKNKKKIKKDVYCYDCKNYWHARYGSDCSLSSPNTAWEFMHLADILIQGCQRWIPVK